MSFIYKNASQARQEYNFAMDASDGKKAQPYTALLIAERNLDKGEMIRPLAMLLNRAIAKDDAASLQDLLYRYSGLIEPNLKENIIEVVVRDKASRGEFIEAVDYVITSKDCSAKRLALEFHKRAMEEKKFEVAALMWDRYKIGPTNSNEGAVRFYLSQIREGNDEGALFTIKMYSQTLRQYLLPTVLMKARRIANDVIKENTKDALPEGTLPDIKALLALQKP